MAHALATGKKMHKGKMVGGETASGRATNGVSAAGVSKGGKRVVKVVTQTGGRSGGKTGLSKALKTNRLGAGDNGAGVVHLKTALKQKKAARVV